MLEQAWREVSRAGRVLDGARIGGTPFPFVPRLEAIFKVV